MDYLAFLQKEIHAAAFATLAEDGRPEVRIIDVMLYDGKSLYFLTANGCHWPKGWESCVAARICAGGGPSPSGCDV